MLQKMRYTKWPNFVAFSSRLNVRFESLSELYNENDLYFMNAGIEEGHTIRMLVLIWALEKTK